jgi:DNA-binding CsgD family transcriptional regulator
MEVQPLMESAQRNSIASQDPGAETRVCIIGRNNLQNYLLGSYIEEKTGLACSCLADMTAVPLEAKPLVLYDCFSIEDSRLWISLESYLNRDIGKGYLALFNVDPELRLEKDAVARGVRGLFYRDESPDIMSKGVSAILNEELWYSRKTTTRLLLDNSSYARTIQVASFGLTTREKEILREIAAGASNTAIADKFNISAHTVKNHIYNIYRKIKVKSRLEAVLWVTEHL